MSRAKMDRREPRSKDMKSRISLDSLAILGGARAFTHKLYVRPTLMNAATSRNTRKSSRPRMCQQQSISPLIMRASFSELAA